LAAGFIPAATLSQTSASRDLEWLLKQVRTVFRKESRPGAKRPVDEREPSGFPLISQRRDRLRSLAFPNRLRGLPASLWRPGSSRPRLCLKRLPVVTSSGYLNKSEPYSGKRADPARSARSMRGNHLGSLSYLNVPTWRVRRAGRFRDRARRCGCGPRPRCR